MLRAPQDRVRRSCVVQEQAIDDVFSWWMLGQPSCIKRLPEPMELRNGGPLVSDGERDRNYGRPACSHRCTGSNLGSSIVRTHCIDTTRVKRDWKGIQRKHREDSWYIEGSDLENFSSLIMLSIVIVSFCSFVAPSNTDLILHGSSDVRIVSPSKKVDAWRLKILPASIRVLIPLQRYIRETLFVYC